MARCRVTIPNLREHQGNSKEKLDPLREIINVLHRVYLLTNLSVAREHKLLDYKAHTTLASRGGSEDNCPDGWVLNCAHTKNF